MTLQLNRLIALALFVGASSCASKDKASPSAPVNSAPAAGDTPTALNPADSGQQGPFIIKDVQISFEGGDEAPPLKMESKPVDAKATAKGKSKKGAQVKAKAKKPATPSTSQK